ncbi:MAG: hypothetical protein ACI8RZ_004687 [Myxococcota bacterium]|jgi:hypothetical protein
MLLTLLLACNADKGALDPLDSVEPAGPVRVVTFGDVHGDVDAARGALKLAGVLDDSDTWIGGATQVVQVGDQLDRGDDEREILDLFEDLRIQAVEAGGAFYPLLGNHEVMNVELDLRYVTDGGFADFADVPYESDDAEILGYPEEQRGRVAAFRPAGEYAMKLSEHLVILQLEGTIFVHGGVLPEHVDFGIDAINEETGAWMRGEGSRSDPMVSGDPPIWSRHYSDDPDDADCALLDEVLTMTGADRMVVAHTVQEDGINSACGEQVWRVDVGMAAYYGGVPEVLEIVEGEVLVLD